MIPRERDFPSFALLLLCHVCLLTPGRHAVLALSSTTTPACSPWRHHRRLRLGGLAAAGSGSFVSSLCSPCRRPRRPPHGTRLSAVDANAADAARRPADDATGGGESSAAAGSGTVALSTVTKSQTAVYDGSEFVSIAAFLRAEDDRDRLVEMGGEGWVGATAGGGTTGDGGDADANAAEAMLPEAGYIQFVVGTAAAKEADDGGGKNGDGGEGELSGKRVVGVAVADDVSGGKEGSKEKKQGSSDADGVLPITRVYTDSIAIIPHSISDADAISTAAASLVGIHCGLPRPKRKSAGGFSSSCGTTNKVVILGGGDYATFTAKGLSALGANVSLVTTRPMALKDTPLNPLADTDVDCMGPAIGPSELGFSDALGNFDTVVDTLGDDANLRHARTWADAVRRSGGEIGVSAKLRRANECNRYVSTLTQSQQLVLDDGLLFARDPVIKYQQRVEKKFDPTSSSSKMLRLVPPRNFGHGTLQKLFDAGVTFSSDKNENGEHKKKDTFVKGWSFPDYTEREVWPRDTSGSGSGIRFGFPAAGELALEAAEEKMMGIMRGGRSDNEETKKESGASAERTKKDEASKKPNNPYVTTICDLSELREEIVEKKRDCLLFVSATYCRVCKTLSPGYTRMARLSLEETPSGGEDDDKGDNSRGTVVFAKANTASKVGKRMAFSLKVDSVPTFILFKKGERYGEPLGVTRLPSEKLELAVEYLRSGKDWDPEVFKEDESERESRTKLN